MVCIEWVCVCGRRRSGMVGWWSDWIGDRGSRVGMSERRRVGWIGFVVVWDMWLMRFIGGMMSGCYVLIVEFMYVCIFFFC